MKINKINDEISVSEQIHVDDLKIIKDAGFNSIICNRPDNESADQTPQEIIKSAAESVGLNYFFIPIFPGQFTQEAVDEFNEIFLEKENGPIFAYCRTGTRSCTLWAPANRDKITANEIVEQAKGAGYDLSQLFL